jgi:hypothetical protein
MASRSNLKTGHQVVTTAGTPVQLPDFRIGEDCYLVVKAKKTNTGVIGIGYSSETALLTNTDYFSLEAGEELRLKVDSPIKVWIDASVSGEGVEYITEA